MRFVSMAVSAAILAVIYSRIDIANLIDALARSRIDSLILAAVLFAPNVLLLAARFRILVPPGDLFGLRYSVRLVLASAVLNAVLPSKLGDLSRAWALRDRAIAGVPVGLAAVILDRALDLLSLLLLACIAFLLMWPDSTVLWSIAAAMWIGLVAGALLIARKGTVATTFRIGSRFLPAAARKHARTLEIAGVFVHEHVATHPTVLGRVSVISIACSATNIAQTWFFVVALGIAIPLADHIALSTAAILAGLIPITFAGIGTRDAAIVALYSTYTDPATSAALGVLFTMRYIVLVVVGIPSFLSLFGSRANRMDTDDVLRDDPG